MHGCSMVTRSSCGETVQEGHQHVSFPAALKGSDVCVCGLGVYVKTGKKICAQVSRTICGSMIDPWVRETDRAIGVDCKPLVQRRLLGIWGGTERG